MLKQIWPELLKRYDTDHLPFVSDNSKYEPAAHKLHTPHTVFCAVLCAPVRLPILSGTCMPLPQFADLYWRICSAILQDFLGSAEMFVTPAMAGNTSCREGSDYPNTLILQSFCSPSRKVTDCIVATCALMCFLPMLQAQELKMQIKKQSIQLQQSGATVKDAEQTAETAQQHYKEHLQQLQSQLEQAQNTVRNPASSPDTAGAESALHAELQSLRSQLAEAQQEVTSLQQQQAQGGSASVLPNSSPSTPSKTGAASPAHDSAAQESAAQDSSMASAEKEAAKDRDAQLQVVLQCMNVRVTAYCHTTATSASSTMTPLQTANISSFAR